MRSGLCSDWIKEKNTHIWRNYQINCSNSDYRRIKSASLILILSIPFNRDECGRKEEQNSLIYRD